MSSSRMYRIGGFAAIVGVVVSLGYFVSPLLLKLGVIGFALYAVALRRLFGAGSALAGAAGSAVVLVAILGALLLVLLAPAPSLLFSAAILGALFVPALVFGFLATAQPAAGFPRPLALTAIVGGGFGAINFALIALAGGDFSKPTIPALAPLILWTYYIAALATLVWLVWGGVCLLRRKS